MSTGAQRQQRLKAKRQEAGQQQMRFWVADREIEALKQRYTGPRGGIDWTAVVAAALAPPEPPRSSQPLPTNAPPAAEPFAYWKPGGPFTPMDERCQARNHDGSRCRSKGRVIVRALVPNRGAGEFKIGRASCRERV